MGPLTILDPLRNLWNRVDEVLNGHGAVFHDNGMVRINLTLECVHLSAETHLLGAYHLDLAPNISLAKQRNLLHRYFTLARKTGLSGKLRYQKVLFTPDLFLPACVSFC